MSIISKVRTNPDYIHVTRLLADLNIEWELCAPMGKGHPYLLIEGHRYPIGTSPGRKMPSKLYRGSIKRFLRSKGIIQ